VTEGAIATRRGGWKSSTPSLVRAHAMGAADQDGVAPDAHRASTRRRHRTLDDEPRDRFLVSSAAGFSAKLWNAWIRGHWRIENGSHHVRDTTFAEDASRIRKNPTSQRAYAPSPIICSARTEAKTSKMPDGAPRSISTFCSISSPNIKN